jgi:Protein of unknown function (DUF2798)
MTRAVKRTTFRVIMPKLPKRYAPFVYGIIQAAITTAIATAVATRQLLGGGMEFFWYWLGCWALSWITMLPVVILVAPLIQRAVLSLTAYDDPSAH